METDAKKMASGGNWGYTGSQPKWKAEIPDKRIIDGSQETKMEIPDNSRELYP
jgi:hypothetical protein